MTRRDKIVLLGFIMLAGTILVWVSMLLRSEEGYPQDTILFRPDDRLNDFRNMYRYAENSGDPGNPLQAIVQGAPLRFIYLLVRGFGAFVLSANQATLIYLVLFAFAFLAICRRELRLPSALESWQNTLIIAFLSYPFLYTVDRANIEGLIFLLVYVFFRAFQKGRLVPASAALGIALALKPFPAVFFVLYLTRGRWMYIPAIIGVAAALNGAAIMTGIGGPVSLTAESAALYQAMYVVGDEGLLFGHSLWGALKIASYLAGVSPEGLLTGYFFAALAIFAAVAAALIRSELPLWRKAAILVCCMNVLPFVSGDYKLLHLYVPLFLFLGTSEGDRLDVLYVTLFGLLLMPKPYVPVMAALPEVSIGVVLNPLLMVTLAVAAAIRRPVNGGSR